MSKISRKNHRWSYLAGEIFRVVFLTMHFVITIFPFFWMVSTAVKKEQAEIYAFPVIYWPQNPSLENFFHIAVKGNFLLYFRNSFLYAAIPALVGTLLAILAAYVLARCRFRGRNTVLFLFILTQMLPGFMGLAPKYQMMSRLGLVNTVLGILLIYLSNIIPYSVVTLRSFFDQVPASIEEAALIDGCSRFRVVFTIAVPLVLPGIISVLIFDFVNLWNELFSATLFLDSDHLKTVTIALNGLIQKYDIAWGQLMAGTIISVLPTVLLFALMRKYMIAGLTSGAVKG
ncbi:MAG: carbohydrate ABC transporter permease [Lachnospiraceae bacterium]|jgi:multiple sugar transport system permease protein|nr:carbohydrate ABC transporter permease [Lachnospiraceae bacterium]